MKVRHICAVAGVALAIGTVVFMGSLVATNDHQSAAVAAALLAQVPVETDAKVAQLSLDYRPDGRVMQGPPMMVFAATDRGNKAANKDGCVVTRALFTQRHLPVPPVGTTLTLVGRKSVYRLEIAAVIDWEKTLRGYPNLFVSDETAAAIGEEWRAWEAKSVADLAPGFMSDSARDIDRAKVLLLWAAALTALCLLVNSLFLSIEARRKQIAILRMLGLTRSGVVRLIMNEALGLTAVGLILGIVGGLLALWVYVKLNLSAFPLGIAIANKHILICLLVAPMIAILSALIALKPALSVKPLEAASNRMPRKRHLGMLISFACGFGAFVAVEVWGASLMSAFVPSPEWPDAIVSILPGGVSSFDIEKLQGMLKGVRSIHELEPLQVNFDPLTEMENRGKFGRGKSYRNALFLASDWLPDFKFAEGDRKSALKSVASGEGGIITAMMARARDLHLGDEMAFDCGHGEKASLKVAGIADLNWHMVTSRAHVRGMGRMPSNTDGPIFVSFDTLESFDMRPSAMVKMTHLWLDYDPKFLATHGVFEAGRIVEREIAEKLGLMTDEINDNTVRLHSRDEIADGTLAHGADIIGAMARIPFVFILVISLGFIAMLVASADSRKREFLVRRAVGATRRQIAAVLTGEALKVALIGVVIGFLGGALIGWLSTAGTRAAMSAWGIPPSFAVPYLVILKGALGAIFFAILISVPVAGLSTNEVRQVFGE